ncbi:SS18-like protein [Trichinella spiralis]|uniref:SS18-like protein n=1 Tax=Trichinella spiralis TaxID=6334 RepID=A0ABR3K6A5_TRISP
MSMVTATDSTQRQPTTTTTTLNPSTIQQILDENAQLIRAIMECQDKNRMQDAFQYQQILHRNLIHLTQANEQHSDLLAELQAPFENCNEVSNVQANYNPVAYDSEKFLQAENMEAKLKRNVQYDMNGQEMLRAPSTPAYAMNAQHQNQFLQHQQHQQQQQQQQQHSNSSNSNNNNNNHHNHSKMFQCCSNNCRIHKLK